MGTAAVLLPLFFAALAGAAQAQDVAAGQRIYREGVLPSDAPLQGVRAGGLTVSGRDAACINCHRASGLGTAEGQRVIPPVTARYLFQPRARSLAEVDLRRVQGYSAHQDPYTDAALGEAIRTGRGRRGAPLDYLMPRYVLDEPALRDLTAYLKTLSAESDPGVTDEVIHFATVVAPGIDPARRQAMLDVLQTFFRERTGGTRDEMRRNHTASEVMFRVYRRWELHVWDLEGPPETWEAQLARRYREQPVFAAVAGLGAGEWRPVHRFCEKRALPCLLPQVDAAPEDAAGFYSVYFSAGLALEARILAAHLRRAGIGRVLQVSAPGAAEQAAARSLAAALADSPVALRQANIPARDGEALAAALQGRDPAEAVVLWLPAAELATLPAGGPAPWGVFASATLGGEDLAAWPAPWKQALRLVSAYDLPERRRLAKFRVQAWLKSRGIAPGDERIQVNAYYTCVALSDLVGHMLDNFQRDYLVERAENMLSKIAVPSWYPRLSIAPGQRHAAKGGYLLRYGPDGTALVADSGFVVP